jgi:hypothetical protein
VIPFQVLQREVPFAKDPGFVQTASSCSPAEPQKFGTLFFTVPFTRKYAVVQSDLVRERVVLQLETFKPEPTT